MQKNFYDFFLLRNTFPKIESFDSDLKILESKSNDSTFLKSHDKII